MSLQVPSAPCANQVFEAAKTGDALRVRTALEQMKDSHEITAALETKAVSTSLSWEPVIGEMEATPLVVAAELGHVDCVKELLRHNANIETQAKFMAVACFGMMELSFKFTPLFIAASKGHLNVVRCLAESEADINSTRSNDNSSALMMASLNGHLDVVNFLLEKGANIDHQNSDGETALHYAVAGDSSDVVHTLMSRGASQLYNSNGMTPLLDSCNGCSISVAEVLLTRPELTKQQRIDSLELLGASLATDTLNRYFTEPTLGTAFQFLKRAMRERFQVSAGQSKPLLKQQAESMEPYQNRKESQSLEELAQIEGDRNAIIMEGLIIKERILGKNNLQLMGTIQAIAEYQNGCKNYYISIRLFKRVIDIAQHFNKSIDFALNRIINVLYQMIQSDCPPSQQFLIRLLEQTVLEYEKQPEKLTRELHSVESEETRNFLTRLKENEEGGLRNHLLRLLQIFSKLGPYDKHENTCLSLLMDKLSRVDPRDEFGNSLVHLAVGEDRNELLHVIAYPNSPFSLPCIDTVKLLLNAGMDVNGVNNNGYTPLHRAVTLKPSDDKIQILSDILEALFNGGAHHDFANNKGKTPMDLAVTTKACSRLQFEKRKLELKCISARAVKKFRLSYLGKVPKTLERYITMH